MKKKPFSMHVDVDAFLPATETEKEYMVQMRPPVNLLPRRCQAPFEE